ncbi:MAG: hypothetical protein AAGG01_09510 [Planctomycetota bacterium]
MIPVVDMGRVMLGRLRRGVPFWRGDRTHVGHLLQGIGFSGLTTAVLVGLTFIPTLVALKLLGGSAPLASGLLAGAALYFGILVMADGANQDDLAQDGDRALVTERSADMSVSDVFARASGREGQGRVSGADDGGDSPQRSSGGGALLRPSQWSRAVEGSSTAVERLPEAEGDRAEAEEFASGPFAAPGPEETTHPAGGVPGSPPKHPGEPFLGEDSA